MFNWFKRYWIPRAVVVAFVSSFCFSFVLQCFGVSDCWTLHFISGLVAVAAFMSVEHMVYNYVANCISDDKPCEWRI